MIKQQILDCPVLGCELINEDVHLITLGAPENKSFEYLPGQYLFIQLSEDDARPYSIASSPAYGHQLQLHIKDIPGNHFSGQVIEKLNSDSHIKIKLPGGFCTIDRSSGIRPLLFIAGGTGYAPCQSIIQSLIDADDSRSIILYWGANRVSELYLRDKPKQWQQEQDNFTFIPVIAEPDNSWLGETGFVHEAVFRNIEQLSDYDIYVNGSSAMLLNIYRQLRDKGVPSDQIFSDMLDILREKGELELLD